MKRYPYLVLKYNRIVMLNEIISIHYSTSSVIIELVNGDLIECFSSKDEFEVHRVCEELIAWIKKQDELQKGEFPDTVFPVFDFNSF